MLAATIGGASLGAYSGQGATELDSHANMAVAGFDCTVIATSSHYATVTPFSSNLPTMDMVEIGDVAIAYDDPISLQTYLLVMRNALLIPTMDHNLVPPSRFNNVVDAVYVSNERSHGCPLTEDEFIKQNAQKICVQLASLGINYEPHCFATQVTENARVSHAAMALGSVSMDNDACDIFETKLLEVLATGFATIHAVSAGRSKWSEC